jgi:hypothetical protein
MTEAEPIRKHFTRLLDDAESFPSSASTSSSIGRPSPPPTPFLLLLLLLNFVQFSARAKKMLFGDKRSSIARRPKIAKINVFSRIFRI